MAVEKSFVIKNGLEVNKSLLVANEDLQRVGVQSAVPEYTLDVRGGIGATDLYVGSAATVSNTFTVGSGNSSLVYANIGIYFSRDWFDRYRNKFSWIPGGN